MTTPRAAPCVPTARATRGVGTTPRLTGENPAPARPVPTAISSAGPENRVSRPISTTRLPPSSFHFLFSLSQRPTAVPSCWTKTVLMTGPL